MAPLSARLFIIIPVVSGRHNSFAGGRPAARLPVSQLVTYNLPRGITLEETDRQTDRPDLARQFGCSWNLIARNNEWMKQFHGHATNE